MAREINVAGLALIKSFETCRLDCYPDQGEKPTIGWGHLVTDDDDFEIGDIITQAEADAILLDDLAEAKAIADKVTVPLTDNQYAALVSLAFNAGAGPIDGGVGRKLSAKDYQGAASQFLLWVHVKIDGVETVSAGLVNRRKAEVQLFLTKNA